MFKKAQIKLTIIYSALIITLFWGMSFAIYNGMRRYLGEAYVSQVSEYQSILQKGDLSEREIDIIKTAGRITLSHLRRGFLIFNSILFILIPIASWFLAKKTLQPIQVAHDQQKQFVSDVSHELRTPLAIIQGEMELALEKERSSSEYQEIVKRSKEESVRLVSLVENLLFLARYDQGKMKIPSMEVDMVEQIYKTMRKYKQEAQNKEIQLVFEPPEEVIVFQAHESFISELISNLLDNAIKYAYPQRKVTLECLLENPWIILKVRDFGLVIPPEDVVKIWDRFYRVDTSRSENKGYGLGLSICKSIVSYYKGTIHVHSNETFGTVFTVKIPS